MVVLVVVVLVVVVVVLGVVLGVVASPDAATILLIVSSYSEPTISSK